jgi:hypothetical protein
VTFWRIACDSCSAAFGSRYSLRNLTEFLFHGAEFFEIFEDALCFFFVDYADGESDVNQNIFADFGFGRIGEVDFFADAAEIDLAAAEGDVFAVHDFDNAAWNGKTHFESLSG